MSYKYATIPLTPAVFAELATELYEPGATVSRRDLIDRVATEHERRGGLPARGALTAVAKKAIQVLAKDALIESVSQGFWRFGISTDPAEIKEPIELGEGKEAVYVYYFPAYRDQAAYLGRSEWPMKVGMTTSPDISLRTRDQSGTAMPERPVIGLIYRTSDARSAEKMLHAVLQQRGRKADNSPGVEWFTTGLAEIQEILNFATKA